MVDSLSPSRELSRVRIGAELMKLSISELKGLCRTAERDLLLPSSLINFGHLKRKIDKSPHTFDLYVSENDFHLLARLENLSESYCVNFLDDVFRRSNMYVRSLAQGNHLPDADPSFLQGVTTDLVRVPQGKALVDFIRAKHVPVYASLVPETLKHVVRADGFMDQDEKFIRMYQREDVADTVWARAYYAAVKAHEARHAWQFLDPANAMFLSILLTTDQTGMAPLFITKVVEADAAANDNMIQYAVKKKLMLSHGNVSEEAPDERLQPDPVFEEKLTEWLTRYSMPVSLSLALAETFNHHAEGQTYYIRHHHGTLIAKPDFYKRWNEFSENLPRPALDFLRAVTRVPGTNISYLEEGEDFGLKKDAIKNLLTVSV